MVGVILPKPFLPQSANLIKHLLSWNKDGARKLSLIFQLPLETETSISSGSFEYLIYSWHLLEFIRRECFKNQYLWRAGASVSDREACKCAQPNSWQMPNPVHNGSGWHPFWMAKLKNGPVAPPSRIQLFLSFRVERFIKHYSLYREEALNC